PPRRRGGRTFVLRNARWVSETGLEGGRVLLYPDRFDLGCSLAAKARVRRLHVGHRLADLARATSTPASTRQTRSLIGSSPRPPGRDAPPGFYDVHYPGPRRRAGERPGRSALGAARTCGARDKAADRESFVSITGQARSWPVGAHSRNKRLSLPIPGQLGEKHAC
ncbi:MAG TPA: hypothetical protein VFH51_02205, partial [Myxococcota bacterium]|nr:hypothetical protein [Myxococcota bacterium]